MKKKEITTGETFAALINCMDGRVQSPISDWLKTHTGVQYVDRITEPGPDKVLASGQKEKIEIIKQKVLLSMHAHGSKIIAVSGHHDCAGDPVSDAQHHTHIRKAVREIASWNLNTRIIGLWVNEKREVKLVEDTAHRREEHHTHEHKHVHHGKSTRDLLNARNVLKKAGLKKGHVFLDAGCGDGYMSLEASGIAGRDGKIFALDAHKESVERVKQEIKKLGLKNVQALHADITKKTPLRDSSIDMLLMANALHGFVENDEIQDVIREVQRILKPGGTLAVVDFKKVEGTPGPPLSVRLSEADVEKIFAPGGYKVKKHVEAGQFHYLVLMEKAK